MNWGPPDVQAGFRYIGGTRAEVVTICSILEVIEIANFVDHFQFIYSVDSNKLWKTLKEMGMQDHLTRLLRNLYAWQEATVTTMHRTTDSFRIEKGVWWGCLLTPCLFSFYALHIMIYARLDKLYARIKITDRNVNNLRYVCEYRSNW